MMLKNETNLDNIKAAMHKGCEKASGSLVYWNSIQQCNMLSFDMLSKRKDEMTGKDELVTSAVWADSKNIPVSASAPFISLYHYESSKALRSATLAYTPEGWKVIKVGHFDHKAPEDYAMIKLSNFDGHPLDASKVVEELLEWISIHNANFGSDYAGATAMDAEAVGEAITWFAIAVNARASAGYPDDEPSELILF